MRYTSNFQMYRHTQFKCSFQVLPVKAYWSVNKWYLYKYLLVQIHSSDSFFWVGFISCVIYYFFWKKLYDPFLWMAFSCLKATEPIRGGTRVGFNDSWFLFHDSSWSFHEPYFSKTHIFHQSYRVSITRLWS